MTSPLPRPGLALVVDDCGSAVANAAVLASFSNGDPPLVLNSLQNGIYTGTWRPTNAAQQVTVTVQATLPPLASAQAQTQGQVTGNASAPAVFGGGVVNGAAPRQG